MKKPKSTKASTPSGEGERRAMRGYIPQYDLGSRLLYQGLASGELQWVGIADRSVGAFDDIVLGLFDRIEAYQVKTSQTPAGFSIQTLLLGSPAILDDMVASATKLWAEFGEKTVETIYACDDFPYDGDSIGDNGPSSAAFLRLHEAKRQEWNLSDWKQSQFSVFVQGLQHRSKLDDAAFTRLLQNMRFLTGGNGRHLGFAAHAVNDEKRMGEVAALLPRLISTPQAQDRWTVSELLSQLRWHNPFELKHSHLFPIDALYQNNERTQDALMTVLASQQTGYVSLLGPPGSGKSTLLATGLLPIERASILRYTAFVPGEGQGLGRAEAYDFLHDLIKQFKEQNLGRNIMVGTEISEVRTQFQQILREAGGRYTEVGTRTIIVIDGLDHVPREERPQLSFLTVLPLPQAVPAGVLFLLGSQRLDFPDIPPAVSDQATENGRCLNILPLSREEIARLADLANVPEDVDRDLIFERSEGHPLSARYLISGVVAQPTDDDREAWLNDGPSYGGDVNVFYQKAWREVERSIEAARGMAYLALIEGTISLQSLDALIGDRATDAVMAASKHLLRQGRDEAWSIFHNSFRLFLREKTGTRHGSKDEVNARKRYHEMAHMAAGAPDFDRQKWLQLRYLARADDHAAVAALATTARFRAEFISGRDPTEIRADIDFAMRTAGVLRLPDLVIELIFARHEINRRSEAFGDEIFDAWLALNEFDRARALVEADGITLSISKGYELVDAYLEAGEGDNAREVFDEIEPLDQLMGTEPVKVRDHDQEITYWARRALAFRTPKQFLATLTRLQNPNDPFESFDLESFLREIKVIAARGQIERNYKQNIPKLAEALQLPASSYPVLYYFAGSSAYYAEDLDGAKDAFAILAKKFQNLHNLLRSDAGLICARIGSRDLAELFAANLPFPGFDTYKDNFSFEWVKDAAEDIFRHAELLGRLKLHIEDKADQGGLLAKLEGRIARLGHTLGALKAGHAVNLDVRQELKSYVDFLKYARSEERVGADRMKMDRALSYLMSIAVDVAAAAGPDIFGDFLASTDQIFQNDPGLLGRGAALRGYAVTAFRNNHDAVEADRRIVYANGIEDTPDEQLTEAAETAIALVKVGSLRRARELLNSMHDEGLGWAREAKKDPQYRMWDEFFRKANAEDRKGAPDRIAFYGRLLAGMSDTKGSQAAGRLSVNYLSEAAQTSTAWALASRYNLDQWNLADWVDQVRGLTIGVATKNPNFSSAAALIYGRLGLPLADDYSPNVLPRFIELAPERQRAAITQSAMEHLAIDCRRSKRIQYMTETVEVARSAGIEFEVDLIERWRQTLAKPRSGNSPEDPFFLCPDLQSAAKIYHSLAEGTGKYGVTRAFEHLAKLEGFEAMVQFLVAVPEIAEDERALAVAAEISVSAGKIDKAKEFLAALEVIAKEKGGWGSSFSGDAKRRALTVRALVEGEPARQKAFDIFVDDMANRREYLDYMIGDLADIIEIISPRPSWASAWSLLEAHLKEFRDYKIGEDVKLPPTEETEEMSDARSLAEILLIGVRSNAIKLVNLIRPVCRELLTVPHGEEIVAAAVNSLLQEDGIFTLEGAQLAWDCRDSLVVRAVTEPRLQQLACGYDQAISQIVEDLADLWGVAISWPEASLPITYTMELPANPNYERFEPPSGISEFTSGLYTESPLSWTWLLKRPIGWTADASGFPIANLRIRAGSLMSAAGGLDAFGSEAAKAQNSTLRRLRLHISFRKISTLFAFKAMRGVVGELFSAGYLGPDDLNLILPATGAYSSILPPISAEIRPEYLSAVEISRDFHKRDEWLSDATPDLLHVESTDVIILAATSHYRAGLWADERTVHQYWGPKRATASLDRIESFISEAPCIHISETVVPLYSDRVAPGGVVHSRLGHAEALAVEAPLLCPKLAFSLGWKPLAGSPLTWVDDNGDVMAKTAYWRDGGIHSHETDHDTAGDGYVLWILKRELDKVRRALSQEYVTLCWRTDRDGETNVKRTAFAEREVAFRF